MGVFEHYSRKCFVISGAVAIALIMVCLKFTSPWVEDHKMSPVIAANHSNADPWYCSCYPSQVDDSNNNSSVQETQGAILPDEKGQASPLVVPESFNKPDQELVDKINGNMDDKRVLIVAAANYGMREYVYNWIESLKRTGEGDRFLVFCLDDQLYSHMVAAGYEQHAATIPRSWFHDEVHSDFEEYYSIKYRIITHAKTLIVQQLLYMDVTVLFSDVDVVWLRPRLRDFMLTFLQIRSKTQAIFQQEGTDQKVINSGFYLMRPSDDMKRLLAETIYLADTDKTLTQQGAMNAALDHVNMELRSTGVVLLDILHFPNGYVYFENDWCRQHGVDPYMVHANYLVSNNSNGLKNLAYAQYARLVMTKENN